MSIDSSTHLLFRKADINRTHDLAEAIRKVYDELRLIGACHKVSYPTIKKWFLETYPEIVEFGVEGVA